MLERLSELGLTDVLVHAGQSSVRASGSLGGDGWRIGIGVVEALRRRLQVNARVIRDIWQVIPPES